MPGAAASAFRPQAFGRPLSAAHCPLPTADCRPTAPYRTTNVNFRTTTSTVQPAAAEPVTRW